MSTEKAPIAKLANTIQKIENKTRSAVKSTAKKTSNLAQNVLKDDINDVEKTNIFATPFHIVGDEIGATAGNFLKTTHDVAAPALSAVSSAYDITLGALFNPIDTITSPLQYLKNVANVPVSIAQSGSSLAKSIFKVPHTLWDKGIRKPINRLNFHIENIPLIGSPVAGITNWVANNVSKVTGGIVKGADYITSPIEATQRFTST